MAFFHRRIFFPHKLHSIPIAAPLVLYTPLLSTTTLLSLFTMKYTPLTLLTLFVSSVAASPVPAIEWVTVTHFTTVFGVQAAATQASTEAQSASSAASSSASSPETLAIAQQETVETSVATSTPSSTAIATTEAATTSSSTTSAAATSAAATSSGPSGSDFSGEGTYYDTGLGACGITNSDTDYIVAISHELFDQYTPNGNPNKNSLCGKKIKASYEGKSVEVTVVDRCEGCAYNDLDFSPSAFTLIADKGLGRIDITWEWA